jgi:DHA2 family lincomycin resistance protein-like MFS transporter
MPVLICPTAANGDPVTEIAQNPAPVDGAPPVEGAPVDGRPGAGGGTGGTSSDRRGPTPADATDDAPRTAAMTPRERLAVGLLLFSAFVVILNETTMSVALPPLMADLGITAGTAQWVTTAFLLTMAVVIPMTGFILQRLGTRAVFLTAMTLFSAGTLLSALAPVFAVLIAGRVVQATGTAIMMPLLMTTVMSVTPAASRGRTMGNISVVISVAPALGPTLSGAVLAVLPWRGLFWLMLPIALGALALGALRLPDLTQPRPARVDLLSVGVSAFAFGGLVYGLSQVGESAGHGNRAVAWGSIVVGLAALSFFIARQLRLQVEDRALLDLRTFTSPTFRLAVALMGVSMMALFGTIILLPLYAQDVLGLAPLQAGLLVLPGGLLMGVAAPFVGRAFDRVGPRPLLMPGTTLVALATWGLATLSADSAPWLLLACHVTMSGGLALIFTPLFTSALGSLSPRLYSHGSAVVGTVQQVAGAAGIALFVMVMTLQSVRLTDRGASEVAATAGGIHTAFLVGAVIATLAIPAALAFRAPAPTPAPVTAGS